MYTLYLPLGLALNRWLINLGTFDSYYTYCYGCACLLTLQHILCKDRGLPSSRPFSPSSVKTGLP